jgi:hypothetical protein
MVRARLDVVPSCVIVRKRGYAPPAPDSGWGGEPERATFVPLRFLADKVLQATAQTLPYDGEQTVELLPRDFLAPSRIRAETAAARSHRADLLRRFAVEHFTLDLHVLDIDLARDIGQQVFRRVDHGPTGV